MVFNSQKFKIKDAASYNALTEQFDYYTEQFSFPLAEYMVDLAEIASFEKVLDIGTGTGVVALQAAKMVDSGGIVYGIDLSEEMLKKAEKKSKQIQRNLKFFQMDAETLHFENEVFDVAVSLFALLHFPDPLAALKEIYRVLRPGGRIVIAIGSGASILSIGGIIHIAKRFPDFFQEFLGKQLIAPRFLNSLVKKYVADTTECEESQLASQNNLSRPQKVIELIKKAGFNILKTDWHGHQHKINSPQHFWEIQRTFSSIARKRLMTATSIEYQTVYDNFINACRRVQSRGGSLTYPVGAFYIVAHRPVL